VSANVPRLITASVAAAILVFAAAALLFQVRDAIGGVPGIAFWTVLTLIASALPVRLPGGTVTNVGVAPVLATLALGGPIAGGVVALIGSTDSRELRGQVPWYGTLFNHSSIVIAAVFSGSVYELALKISDAAPTGTEGLLSFVGLMVAAVVYYLVNAALAVVAVSARTGTQFRAIWAQDVRGIAPNLIGLAPLSWLMAQIFLLPNGVGWWATPLFVIPLFTTRLAYHRYVETRELFEQTIGALASAVDARDPYTAGHSRRVSYIADAMARSLKLPDADMEIIKWAGLLHDVGKIGIRDHVLLKEGPLDKEERILMNQHPTIGAEIVAPAQQLSKEAPLIRTHHEWFNGSGYPGGIEATDIPLGARLLGVADAYEAMTSSRPYRKTPLSHEIAVGELKKFSGIQFDPQMVETLLGLSRETLDWRPENADVLHRPTAASGDTPTSDDSSQQRPMLASDDVS
jgi:putative nucleotidyltransferase with HDIG domain